jgi:hypothetical protein
MVQCRVQTNNHIHGGHDEGGKEITTSDLCKSQK